MVSVWCAWCVVRAGAGSGVYGFGEGDQKRQNCCCQPL